MQVAVQACSTSILIARQDGGQSQRQPLTLPCTYLVQRSNKLRHPALCDLLVLDLGVSSHGELPTYPCYYWLVTIRKQKAESKAWPVPGLITPSYRSSSDSLNLLRSPPFPLIVDSIVSLGKIIQKENHDAYLDTANQWSLDEANPKGPSSLHGLHSHGRLSRKRRLPWITSESC